MISSLVVGSLGSLVMVHLRSGERFLTADLRACARIVFLFLLSGFSDKELKFQSFLLTMDAELQLAYATTSYIIAVKKN